MDNFSVQDILADDPRGTGLGAVREEVLEMDQVIRHHMDTGLSPDDMALAVKARNAAQAAARILEKLPSERN